MRRYIYKSATELAGLIREGKATSTDIVKEHLGQIHDHNDKLNALISIFAEEALQQAELCDREAMEGKFRGPLHGVPVTVKEQFWMKGKRCTVNFKMFKDFVASEDAVIVKRIKNSGAIILGQTNVPRMLIDYQVAGDIYPEGKNPYNTDYSPGGSTGGGAAALAAGFTTLELGEDFGGSVRVPANFCGLYGLKPTEKTVPFHGNGPLSNNTNSFLMHMIQAGPLARSVDDVELLWNIIKGPDESDRNIPDINWQPSSGKSLADYKIAWTDSWPGFETSTQISKLIQSLAITLKTLGCIIEKKIPDNTIHQESLETFVGLFPYIIVQGTPRLARSLIKLELYGKFLKGIKKELPHLVKIMNQAFKFNVNHYGKMILQRSLITQRWEHFFNDFDFLICPVAFGPSYKRCKLGTKLHYDGKEMIYLNYAWPYVACFNASGNPSLTIPLGLGEEGLPLGVQIVGKYWSEPELFNFSKKVAALTRGFIKPNGYD
ncbi:MAG: amidase [Bacteroidetes bacterium]|nr:amidase [Bacteroidota bacterium]